MASSNKDTIYVDIDDEITGIIDKVQNSSGKVVALVLPKRAAVFQSIVNMKLLKRAGDAGKKNLVLITSEAGLLPLAGASGIHVAKTLNSKPEIPVSPDMDEDDEEVDEDEAEELADDDAPLDTAAPVGALAAAKAADDGVETLTLDDEDLPPEEAEAPKSKDFAPPKAKKDKKLKVPDFDRFRLLLILGGLALILLIFFMIFAVKVLPKATISIKTDATSLDTTVPLNLSTTATKLDEAENTVPAKLAQQQKTYTQQVPTTGQKNNGNKASGTIVLTNCSQQDDDITIPAGSSFSSNGNTFITQKSVSLPPSSFNNSHSKCTSSPSASVDILALYGGTAYNDATSFTAGSPYGGVTGKGSTSGGTDSIVQSVNQNDITSAKNKIQAASDNDMKKTLKGNLSKDNYYAIEATYSSGTPTVTNSANVGEVANNVTVTETVTYTMFGVHKKDLQKLAANAIKEQIDTSKQSILDDGVDSASYNADNITATGGKVTMTSSATAGPDLDTNSIKQNSLGKKPAEVKSNLETYPGVKNVDVKLSPFWVGSVPGKTSKIKVVIAKPDSSKPASSNGSNQ
jgi:hypothetical protein